MLAGELKILFQHGIQYVEDVEKVNLPHFRGRPEIEDSITENEIKEIVTFCPTGAFNSNPVGIDMGKCVFCRECEFSLPEKIRFTSDYKIASTLRDDLFIKQGFKNSVVFNDDIVRKEIKQYFGNALKLRQVSAGGDNACEMELNACGNVNFDMGRWGIEFVASPRHADGIVITGPITENMSKALEITYQAIPSPKIVILAGTDAISGGIFAESNALNRSFLNKYPIDLYVPGNPVHPLTFINGILKLISKRAR